MVKKEDKTMIKLLFLKIKLRIGILSLLLLIPSLNFFASPTDPPHPEHPKPQFYRSTWINLNGEWDFEFDFGKSGVEKEWMKDPSSFSRKIMVPFPPESELSGIKYTDFMPSVWYHRTIEVPENWKGDRIFLHFGAVDYDCRTWINGKPVGRHYGGGSSFSFEITDTLKEGKNDLVVCAMDEVRSRIQPAGKQSQRFESHGVMYTRTTGIWQTVWLEARPKSYIQSVYIVPDLDESRFILTPVIKDCRRGMKFRATFYSEEGEKITSETLSASTGCSVILELDNPHPWSLSHPYLYGLLFELLSGGEVIDSVESYAGLRKFHIESNKFYLNNEPIFLRFVLDQGFYPDGIWSAPNDEALKKDIELSLAVGFNGARLHQKVFPERFHYWADRLGYLTWGEFADWGLDLGDSQAVRNHNREWREVLMRDRNHPSIIAWTPFNETTPSDARDDLELHRRAIKETVDLTHHLDPTRPVNDTSGYVHVLTDIYTVHDYEQDPKVFQENYVNVAPDKREGFRLNSSSHSVPYQGQPYMVDEYGGTFWTEEFASMPVAESGIREYWGMGKSSEEVLDLIEKLTIALTNHPHIAGFCYTELYDIEQEVNGVYTYDRKLKFDANRLREIFGAPAAIEKR
jgi:beta-galactosidase/beta-glucuronidase